MEEFDQVQPDPLIANLNEHELWQYLQMIVMGEPMITESIIDNEEIETSDMDPDDIFINSSTWSDEDNDFDPYVVFTSSPMILDTPEYTDDEDIAG